MASFGFDDASDVESFQHTPNTTAFPLNHTNFKNKINNGTGNNNYSQKSNASANTKYFASSSYYTRWLDEFFCISARGSSIKTEIRSGFVTFFTMAYILVVNAEVLSKSGEDRYGEHMNFDSIATATAISAAVGSIVVGVFGNLPFGLAPGMGLNSYFTYGICLRSGLSWHIALTCVFMQGILFMILALTGACNLIQLYAPPCIKKSITVGLGLFQALIGFECMKLVVPGTEVLLQLGDVSDPRISLAMGGMLLICVLLILDVKASMLIGMVGITLFAWFTDLSPWPTAIIQSPSFSNTTFALDIPGYFSNYKSTIPITLMFLFVAIFDTAGVQFMAGQQAGLLDSRDHLPGAKAAFFGAGLSTVIGALLGTSPVIIHNETCAGIQDGARTGLHSVVVALCFLFSIPFIPILRAVPAFATAPPLVIVGMFMMMAAKYIEWERVDEAMPAFLTATILPLTYSIANGMIAGIIAFIVLKLGAFVGGRLTGKGVGADWTELPVPHSNLGETDKLITLENMGSAGTSFSTPRLGSVAPLLPNPTASGLASFDDPLPGSPIPPFIERFGSARSQANSVHSSPLVLSAPKQSNPSSRQHSLSHAANYGTLQ
jgi:AGZA family xanthine/uracil permease-like MFS transporter